ncbi:hypothetical protein O3M35_004423 [Rhynocoris fuscipes]|uniref:WDR19 WD40 repeat domain-containing protein n=1 Tax=Rhynocoris fuscipes TaxID=488301 RepID=A0AAW1CLR9_9HEMI
MHNEASDIAVVNLADSTDNRHGESNINSNNNNNNNINNTNNTNSSLSTGSTKLSHSSAIDTFDDVQMPVELPRDEYGIRKGNFPLGVRFIRDAIRACGGAVELDVLVNRISTLSNRAVLSQFGNVHPTFIAAGMGVLAVGNGNRVLFYEYRIPGSSPNSTDGAFGTTNANVTSTNPKGIHAATVPDSRSVVRDNITVNHLTTGNTVNSSTDKTESHSAFIRSIDYPSIITSIKVCSHFAAVLYEGRVQIHPIHENNGPTMNFPVSPADGKVIAVEMSESLMMFVTLRKICVVALYKMQVVSEYTCRSPIRRAFPNSTCTRVAVMDVDNALYVFNPVTEIASQAEGYESDHKALL